MTVHLTVIIFSACISLRPAVLIDEIHISIISIFIFPVYSLYTTSQSEIEYGKKWDREGKAQSSLSLGICEFHVSFFKPNEHLRLIESWFPDRSASFYSELSRVISQSPLQYSAVVCFEAVASWLEDVSNNRLKCVDIVGIRLDL